MILRPADSQLGCCDIGDGISLTVLDGTKVGANLILTGPSEVVVVLVVLETVVCVLRSWPLIV